MDEGGAHTSLTTAAGHDSIYSLDAATACPTDPSAALALASCVNTCPDVGRARLGSHQTRQSQKPLNIPSGLGRGKSDVVENLHREATFGGGSGFIQPNLGRTLSNMFWISRYVGISLNEKNRLTVDSLQYLKVLYFSTVQL